MPPVNKSGSLVTHLQSLANRQGMQRPASSILTNIEAAATLSKFVRPKEQPIDPPSNPNSTMTASNNGIELISRSIMGRIEDNENIFKLFPDIELAAQIVISSISSPKDMLTTDLNYKLLENRFPPALSSKIVECIRETLNKEYTLQDDIPTILRAALFQSGSYVKAILPEAAVDQLINNQTRITTESIVSSDLFVGKDINKLRHIGYLGDPRPPVDGEKKMFALERAMLSTSDVNYQAGFYAPISKDVPEDPDGLDIKGLVSRMASCLEVSDNFHFLKMPKLIDRVNEQTLASLTENSLKKRVFRFVTESADAASMHKSRQAIKTEAPPSKGELTAMLYKSAPAQFKPFLNLPTKENLLRKSVGKPLVLRIPSEAAIPVHVPGEYDAHVGYFVPVDMDGNPVSVGSLTANSSQGIQAMLQQEKQGSTSGGILTDKARRNLTGDTIVPIVDRLTEIYADLIENDMIERLLKGSYGKKLQVSRNNEIYRIMLARTLQGQNTRLIYIPAEYVCYFAFNYHRNGVGKSYLDDLSNITSMRAMALFSKVMARVKSSIETTKVNVTLDPRDPDPVKTLESAKHLVAKARQQYFPHGLNRVVDLTDWIQRAGIEITFTGHPRLPDTKFDFESKNVQHVEPDDTLDELFRHQTYMHFGLSPETVDSAAKAEFATTIQNNSILFARRIFTLSNIFSAKLTEFGKKIVGNDENIQQKLAILFDEHKGDIEKLMNDEEKALYQQDPAGLTSYLIQMCIDLLCIDLPKPDSTRTAGLTAEIKAQSDLLDAGMEYIFSELILPAEYAGQAASYMAALKSTWKASLMRNWMADNNYAPELFEIANTTEDGKATTNLFESTKSYNTALLTNVVEFLKALRLPVAASDLDIGKITGGEEPPAGGGSSSSSSGSDMDFGGGFGDESGGFGEDIQPDTPETEPPAEEEEEEEPKP